MCDRRIRNSIKKQISNMIAEIGESGALRSAPGAAVGAAPGAGSGAADGRAVAG